MNVTQIEVEIKKWQARIEELGRAREAILTRRLEAEEKRKQYLLAAAEGNGDAKSKLAEIKRQLWDLSQEEEDIALTLESADTKLKELEVARREAVRQQLLNRLTKKAKERLELARQIEEYANKLAEAILPYMKVCREGYSICHQVAPGADRFWLPKDRVFGFLCHKLYEYFPMDLPAPLSVDKRSFVESERESLKTFFKGDDANENAS